MIRLKLFLILTLLAPAAGAAGAQPLDEVLAKHAAVSGLLQSSHGLGGWVGEAGLIDR